MTNRIYCYCLDCNTPIMETDRHIRIPKGETYKDIVAEDGDIFIYQCPNCKELTYGA